MAWQSVARLVAPLVAAALAAGCQSDRPFKTSAVYEAAQGRCTMRRETQGVVRAGDDLARRRGPVDARAPQAPAPPLDAIVALGGGDLTMDGALGPGIDTLPPEPHGRGANSRRASRPSCDEPWRCAGRSQEHADGRRRRRFSGLRKLDRLSDAPLVVIHDGLEISAASADPDHLAGQ